MAIPEVCHVWIEERIKEELPTGKSMREIGRVIAEEIAVHFDREVNPRTIEKRVERTATNVAPHPTIEETTKKPEIKEIKRAKDGTIRGGRREGSGRPIKPPQPTNEDSDNLFQLKMYWRRSSKKDRKAFFVYIKSTEDINEPTD